MYQWRKLSELDRAEILAARKRWRQPWHSPPRWKQDHSQWFHLTAACYEHAPLIGTSSSRLDEFAAAVLAEFSNGTNELAAWCILPNHYHLLVHSENVAALIRSLGQVHGRMSRRWNAADDKMGRKVFHRTADRFLRTEAHFWATVNYVHHNPVRHGYVLHWADWPWSSADEYLRNVGRKEAMRIWQSYPVLEYGEGWDRPDI